MKQTSIEDKISTVTRMKERGVFKLAAKSDSMEDFLEHM